MTLKRRIAEMMTLKRRIVGMTTMKWAMGFRNSLLDLKQTQMTVDEKLRVG